MLEVAEQASNRGSMWQSLYYSLLGGGTKAERELLRFARQKKQLAFPLSPDLTTPPGRVPASAAGNSQMLKQD